MQSNSSLLERCWCGKMVLFEGYTPRPIWDCNFRCFFSAFSHIRVNIYNIFLQLLFACASSAPDIAPNVFHFIELQPVSMERKLEYTYATTYLWMRVSNISILQVCQKRREQFPNANSLHCCGTNSLHGRFSAYSVCNISPWIRREALSAIIAPPFTPKIVHCNTRVWALSLFVGMSECLCMWKNQKQKQNGSAIWHVP